MKRWVIVLTVLCVSAAMIVLGKVGMSTTDERILARQIRQKRFGKHANNAQRTVTPRAAVSQVEIERAQLLQKLEILRQKRDANTAAFEAAKSNLHNGGGDKLERLTHEYEDIMEEMQELRRQIRKMGQ